MVWTESNYITVRKLYERPMTAVAILHQISWRSCSQVSRLATAMVVIAESCGCCYHWSFRNNAAPH